MQTVQQVQLLLLGTFLPSSLANCRVGDAKWQGAPIVTPVSTSKVLVDWSKAIYNPSCVDEYHLLVWKEGTNKLKDGKKYSIRNTKVTQKEIDIEPCVFHKFGVQLIEKDLINTHTRESGETRYNSADLTSFANISSLPHLQVSYYRNPGTAQFDLSLATFTIPTEFLTFASCLKHIDVTATPAEEKISPAGGKARPPARNTTSTWQYFGHKRQPGEMGPASTHGWGHGGSGFNAGGSGSGFNAGGSGSGFNAGSSGSGFNAGSSGSGFNAGGSVSGFNAKGSGSGLNAGGSGSGFNAGGSGSGFNAGSARPTARPPATGMWSYPSSSSRPGSGSGGQGFNPGSGSTGGFNQGSGSRSGFTNQFLRMGLSSNPKTHSVKQTGPFTGPPIQIKVPVEPCTPHTLQVSFVSKDGSELGRLPSLRLAALSDLADYVPPPFTEVLGISLLGGNPSMTVQKGSPVPQSCIPQYLEAVDAFANRVESAANNLVSEVGEVARQQEEAQDKVERGQQEVLDRQGCLCSSPRLQLKLQEGGQPNYETVQAKHKTPVFGVYLYQGLRQGRPFYKLDLEGRSPPTGPTRPSFPSGYGRRRKRAAWIGRVDDGPTTTTRRPWNFGVVGGGVHDRSYGSSSRSSSSGTYSYRTSSSGTFSSRTFPSKLPTGSRGSSSDWFRQTNISIQKKVAVPETPRYLYWEPKAKQWLVSTKVGAPSQEAEFGSVTGSKLSCPGDAKEVWQVRTKSLRSGSGRWQEEPGVSLACAPALD